MGADKNLNQPDQSYNKREGGLTYTESTEMIPVEKLIWIRLDQNTFKTAEALNKIVQFVSELTTKEIIDQDTNSSNLLIVGRLSDRPEWDIIQRYIAGEDISDMHLSILRTLRAINKDDFYAPSTDTPSQTAEAFASQQFDIFQRLRQNLMNQIQNEIKPTFVKIDNPELNKKILPIDPSITVYLNNLGILQIDDVCDTDKYNDENPLNDYKFYIPVDASVLDIARYISNNPLIFWTIASSTMLHYVRLPIVDMLTVQDLNYRYFIEEKAAIANIEENKKIGSLLTILTHGYALIGIVQTRDYINALKLPRQEWHELFLNLEREYKQRVDRLIRQMKGQGFINLIAHSENPNDSSEVPTIGYSIDNESRENADANRKTTTSLAPDWEYFFESTANLLQFLSDFDIQNPYINLPQKSIHIENEAEYIAYLEDILWLPWKQF